ncbi:MAG: hypothetical protein J6Q31_06410 [Alistipes sp.]|nr:hypothetical protein [Alistipes sp.]
MKKYILLLLTLCLCFTTMAQNDIRSQFEAYKQKRAQEYKDYREKANAAFAEYLKKRWADYKPNAAQPAPIPDVLPEPEVAPVEQPKPSTPKPLPAPKNDVESVKDVVDKERPSSNLPTASNVLRVDFFGEDISVPCDKNKLPVMSIPDEQSFSTMWQVFSSVTKPMVNNLEQYSTSHNLNGWGCYQLIKRVSEQAYDNSSPNERIALQAYLLSQLKYRAQVGTCGSALVLLLPFKENIYEVSYLTLGSQKFYIYSYGHNQSQGFRTYDNNFEYAQNMLSLDMNGSMKIGKSKEFEFTRLSAMLGQKLTAPMYLGNIALQYNYPILDNIVYYRQSLSSEFSNAILTPLRQKISGKSETEAVSYLLNLVQNGFGYALDEQVFGRQKQLFIEESFFYEQNNCKDRVGVFSWLVKELVGLDVIGLRYEGNAASDGVGHITCAVAFSQKVEGDAFTFQGKRYVMCDPTYINAGIGRTMPCYANAKPDILAL